MTNKLVDRSHISSLHFHGARSWGGVLGLVPGLNVFVGDSDSGKSNIVRNIRSVLENDSAAAFVRRGDDVGSAEIVFADGVAVRIDKGAKLNSYTLIEETGVEHNGSKETHTEEFKSVGAAVPQRVRDALNMGPVDIQGEPVQLSIAPQRGAAFGVDETPAAVARSVGAVSSLDRLYLAVAEAERRRRKAAQDAQGGRELVRQAKLRLREARMQGDPVTARGLADRAGDALDRAGEARGRAGGLREGVETARALAVLRRSREGPARDGPAALGRAREALARARGLRARVSELLLAIQGATAALNGVTNAAAQRDAAATTASNLRLALDSAVRESGECPLCHQSTGKGHRHAGA